jgi:cephalosporin hydroxylase
LLILFFTGLPSYLSNASENVSDSETVKNFTHHFFEYYTKDPAIMYGSTFLGLVLMQNPADMWIMQEIITEIRPDFIIETGTFAGGAALYYATILNQVNNKGKVITVDIDPKPRIFNINKLKKDSSSCRSVDNLKT